MSQKDQPKRTKTKVLEALREINEHQEDVKEESLIGPELKRLEDTIKRIQDASDTIDPMLTDDMEERMKLTLGLQKITDNMPKLLLGLEELRNKSKLKKEDIKGSKNISPLEGGLLE